MKTLKRYYLVRYELGYQHGSEIETVEMTKEEYQKIQSQNPFDRPGAYFDNYKSALYYTMD